MVEKINAYLNSEGKSLDEAILSDVASLAKWSFKRQFGEREEKGGTLRLSSIGRCIRQQAYNVLGFPQAGKTIDARARMVFFMGDVVEIAILQLAKAAGCKVEHIGEHQASVEIDGVPGHPDGIVTIDGERILVEVKSMNSFAFKEFERGVIDPGYRFQINSYMQALALSRTIVIGLNKDAGVLHEAVISKDNALVSEIRGRIATLKSVTKENLPERPYAPNQATRLLPWNCVYCGFWQTCWPTAEKVLVKNAWKLRIPLKETSNNVATAKT